ncbi:MAG TPA: hypothetical protein VH539_19195 [Gemmatimonadaceae bacterium]
MSNLFFALQEQLEPALRAGDLAQCERAVAASLATLPPSPFHVALDLAIANPPVAVAAHCDRFFRREEARYRVGAAYAEMNGFDINPDRWFFDLFAYEYYGGTAYHEWLPEWRSEPYDDLTIRGLEPLQAVYAHADLTDRAFEDAAYVAGLLVVVKFQKLIQRAAPSMRELHCPLLATAHEYQFIFETTADQSPRSTSGQLPGRA